MDIHVHIKAQGSRSGKVLGIGYSLTGSQIRVKARGAVTYHKITVATAYNKNLKLGFLPKRKSHRYLGHLKQLPWPSLSACFII